MLRTLSVTKKKLTWWQDNFWKHMVRKYPDLERGESASETGRTHIPSRLFKEAVHLNRQRDMLLKLLDEVNPLNAKEESTEIEALLEQYIPVWSGCRHKCGSMMRV